MDRTPPTRTAVHEGAVLGRVSTVSPLRVRVDGQDYETLPTRTVTGYIGSGWFGAGTQLVCVFSADDPDQLIALDAT